MRDRDTGRGGPSTREPHESNSVAGTAALAADSLAASLVRSRRQRGMAAKRMIAQTREQAESGSQKRICTSNPLPTEEIKGFVRGKDNRRPRTERERQNKIRKAAAKRDFSAKETSAVGKK